MSETRAHQIHAKALVTAMFQLNHCWPHWWELVGSEISVANRAIAGPLPDPWKAASEDLRAMIAGRGSLASLNPQPLPPVARDVAVALEIADRLIAVTSLAATLDAWSTEPGRHDGTAVARRLAAEVEDLCPLLVTIKLKKPPFPPPDPDPDPEPWQVKLSPLAQLAMGARFAAAAAGRSDQLAVAYKEAGDRLTYAALANFDREA